MLGWPTVPAREDNPWPHNYHITLQPGQLVIDVDPRNFPNATDSDRYRCKTREGIIKRDVFRELRDDYSLPETRSVKSQNGWHFYYYIPETCSIRFEQKPYPGIDWLTHGRYVIGPGTIKGAEAAYTLAKDVPVADLPSILLAQLEPKPDRKDYVPIDREWVQDQADDIDNYTAFLKSSAAKPAIDGQRGDTQTFITAAFGSDHGLSLDRTIMLMLEYYNPKCQPPWDIADIQRIATNAYKHKSNDHGCRSTQNDEQLNNISKSAQPTKLRVVPTPSSPLADKLADLRFTHMTGEWNYKINQKGERQLVGNDLVNTRLLLQNSSEFSDLMYYDEFSDGIKFNRPPRWDPNRSLTLRMKDEDGLQIKDWLCGNTHKPHELAHSYKVSNETLWDAIYQVALLNRRHPVKDWLESLKWDGKPRLDTILIDTCGAVDSEYARLVGKNAVLSAIARIYKPGTMVRNVLILEGSQLAGKSTWIEALGEPWSSSGEIDPENKDTFQNLSGKWVVELPEVNRTLSPHRIAAIKAIVSRKVDTYRKSYGRNPSDYPRESIFVGSINPTATGYLVDETGDTRYWPVAVRKCNYELLRQMKDQYFAEGMYRFNAGEHWWLEDEQEKLAKEQQDARRKHDPWALLLKEELADTQEISVAQGFKLIGMTIDKIEPRHYERLGTALMSLGFKFDNGAWRRF